jgi:hypothetical protein
VRGAGSVALARLRLRLLPVLPVLAFCVANALPTFAAVRGQHRGHRQRRRTQPAHRGGADYGVFADGRWAQHRNLREMLDYLAFLRAGKGQE